MEPPYDYDLSGDCGSRLADALEALGLTRADTARTGDVMLFRSGRLQQHLGICTGRGFVHAHLGLRRVVETPFPAPWPVLGRSEEHTSEIQSLMRNSSSVFFLKKKHTTT